jgi:hypothetical protein
MLLVPVRYVICKVIVNMEQLIGTGTYVIVSFMCAFIRYRVRVINLETYLYLYVDSSWARRSS